MFGETKKTLIVVYKDEMLMNQLKKMVETNDDDENGVVGTRDNSINIVSWTENVWLDQKKAGNIQGKILYLDDIKGTESLVPVIDVKFDKSGVKYGWAGNQAVLVADTAALNERKDYDAFVAQLSDLPIPEQLKAQQNNTKQIEETSSATVVDASAEVTVVDAPKEEKKNDFFGFAKNAFSAVANAVGTVGNQVAVTTEQIFRDKGLMKRQMLFYGLINMYNDHLEEFMNL